MRDDPVNCRVNGPVNGRNRLAPRALAHQQLRVFVRDSLWQGLAPARDLLEDGL